MKINEYKDTSFMNSTIETINGEDKIVITRNRKCTVKDIQYLYYKKFLSARQVAEKLGIKISMVNKVTSELINRNLIK